MSLVSFPDRTARDLAPNQVLPEAVALLAGASRSIDILIRCGRPLGGIGDGAKLSNLLLVAEGRLQRRLVLHVKDPTTPYQPSQRVVEVVNSELRKYLPIARASD